MLSLVVEPRALATAAAASPATEDTAEMPLSAEEFTHRCELSRPMLYRLAMRETGSPNSAEDLVQQTFLKAWKARASFQGHAKVSTWMSRILLNELYQAYRRPESRLLEFTDEPAELERQRAMAGHIGDSGSAEEMLIHKEQRALLRRAVSSLPKLYRSVIALDIYGGKSTEEICMELQLSEAAVKSRRLRGKTFLQERMQALTGRRVQYAAA